MPSAMRRRAEAWGQGRCSYCQTQERVAGDTLTIEHIMPECLGGPTEDSNLCLSCRACNQHKATRTDAADPLTHERVPLFNPRADAWGEHFLWGLDGTRIVGITAVGRATVAALHMNRPVVVEARRRWVMAGWHPPRGLAAPAEERDHGRRCPGSTGG